MNHVPPAPQKIDPDFWYWYRITMKRLGWGLIGVHLALLCLKFLPLLLKSGGGIGAGIAMVYFVIYSITIIIVGLVFMRSSIGLIRRIFDRFKLDVNTQSYLIISTVVVGAMLGGLLLFAITVLEINVSVYYDEMVAIGYLPIFLYLVGIVIFPIFKFNLP